MTVLSWCWLHHWFSFLAIVSSCVHAEQTSTTSVHESLLVNGLHPTVLGAVGYHSTASGDQLQL